MKLIKKIACCLAVVLAATSVSPALNNIEKAEAKTKITYTDPSKVNTIIRAKIAENMTVADFPETIEANGKTYTRIDSTFDKINVINMTYNVVYYVCK